MIIVIILFPLESGSSISESTLCQLSTRANASYFELQMDGMHFQHQLDGMDLYVQVGLANGPLNGHGIPTGRRIAYLPDARQAVHDQGVLAVIVVVQVQHGGHEVVEKDALAAVAGVQGVERVHDDGLRALDLTAAERASLSVRLLQDTTEGSRVSKPSEKTPV